MTKAIFTWSPRASGIWWYDANVRLRPLVLRNLVLRKVLDTTKNPAWGKLGPKLGRVISHHLGGWNRCILSWNSRWKCCTTPLECKEPKNVLLLIKVFSAIFSFITLCITLPIIYLNIKQNIGHTWLVGPYTLGKLIFSIIFLHIMFLSIKQNLSYTWLFEPHALGKLILHSIFLSIKQNLSYI